MSESSFSIINALFFVIFSFLRLSFSPVNNADPNNPSPSEGLYSGLRIFPRLSFRVANSACPNHTYPSEMLYSWSHSVFLGSLLAW